MYQSFKVQASRLAIRVAAASFTALALAGCSSDSSRLSDPFSNPFGSSARYDRMPTKSINTPQLNTPTYNAPLARVETAPLSNPVQSRPLANLSSPSTNYSAPAMPSPKLSSPRLPAPAPLTTGSTLVKGASFGGWSSTGGASIIATQGETASVLATRYGVPTDAFMKVNGLTSNQISAGTRLTVPVYNASQKSSALSAPAVAPVAPAAPASEKPARLTNGTQAPAPKVQQSAKAAKPEADDDDDAPVAKAPVKASAKAEPAKKEKYKLVKGPDPVAAKPAKTAKVADDDDDDEKPAAAVKSPVKAPVKAPLKTAKVEEPKAVKPVKVEAPKVAKVEAPKVVKQEPVKVAKVEAPAKVDNTPTASLAPVEKPTETANPEFRWPARGRVIQGFKSGGNDGINIAVPEGTSVKAAEGGVVAYAGSELKGYGNLVLIRHPNGFVSAYAHNGEIEVKRGDNVKRGQTIAKSGQSGNVASPQLHFELRKGATPVDPTNYLAGL